MILSEQKNVRTNSHYQARRQPSHNKDNKSVAILPSTGSKVKIDLAYILELPLQN